MKWSNRIGVMEGRAATLEMTVEKIFSQDLMKNMKPKSA